MWKEILLVFLLIALSMSLSNIRLKPKYARDIASHPTFRFLIIFLTAFMIFNLNIDGRRPLLIKLIASFVVASIVHLLLAANTTIINLETK